MVKNVFSITCLTDWTDQSATVHVQLYAQNENNPKSSIIWEPLTYSECIY